MPFDFATPLVFKEGDDCWFYDSDYTEQKTLTKGTVIKVLDLTEHGFDKPCYLIKAFNGFEWLAEARDGLSMSNSEDGPLGYARVDEHAIQKYIDGIFSQHANTVSTTEENINNV